MTRNQFWASVCVGDTTVVTSLMSTQDVQSFINYPDVIGSTPFHTVVANWHESVTKQLIDVRCNVDLRTEEHGYTPLHSGPSPITMS
jgi:hypothetical protein